MSKPNKPKGLANRIQIFRPGTFTPMAGGSVTFSEEDVAAIATSYDPSKHHAPVVAGHPAHDDPARGWVSGLQFSDGFLVADLDEIDPKFSEDVAAGQFKTVSAAFYGPNNASNPTPGTYSLKHVGILGAAVPAVKGLRPINEPAFTDGDGDIVIELSEPSQSHLWDMVADFMSNIRDSLIEDKGKEEADKIIAPFRLNWLREEIATAAAKDQAAAVPGAAFNEGTEDPAPEASGPEAPASVTPETNQPPTNNTPENKEATVPDALTPDELKAREDKLAAREKTLKTAENKAFVEGLAKSGKPLVGEMQTAALNFMANLDDNKTVEFGEGDGKTEATQLDAFKAILKAIPKGVEFGEFAKPEESEAPVAEFAAPMGETVDPAQLALHQKSIEFMARNSGTSYLDAYKSIGGK